MSSDSNISMAKLIKQIRADLMEAVVDGNQRAIKFIAEKVELELKVGVQDVAGVEGGIGGIEVFPIKFGGKAGKTTDNVHTIRLTLTPVGGNDQTIKMSSTKKRKSKAAKKSKTK
ncbi:MAG: trypco2 family protein [Planctomycetota bacterium]